MDSPRSENMSEASCCIIHDDASTSDEELAYREYVRCMNKFAIYLYFTLRQRGLFDNADKSVEEIARDYQKEMLAKNTLENQQQRLVSKLLALEEDPELEEPMDFMETPLVNEQAPSTSKEVDQEIEPPSLLQTEKEKENLQFMQAMGRIKTFVNNNCMSVPRSAIQDVLTSITSVPNSMFKIGGASDSGCDTLNTQQSSMNNGPGHVATREIHSIMRASKCNKLLSKSVDAVIKRLQSVVAKNDLSVYENWEDSHLELCVTTLNQLVDCLSREDEDNEVRKKCTAFIKEVIVDILSFEEMNNRLQEMKYYFLMDLIDNIYSCYDTINFLFEQLSTFESYAKNPECNYKIPIHTIENSYFLFKMLEALMYYYVFETQTKKKKKKKKTSNATYQTCDEWMKSWGNYFGDNDARFVDEEEVKRSIDRWAQLLNQYIVSFTDTFALHAIWASELLESLLHPDPEF